MLRGLRLKIGSFGGRHTRVTQGSILRDYSWQSSRAHVGWQGLNLFGFVQGNCSTCNAISLTPRLNFILLKSYRKKYKLCCFFCVCATSSSDQGSLLIGGLWSSGDWTGLSGERSKFLNLCTISAVPEQCQQRECMSFVIYTECMYLVIYTINFLTIQKLCSIRDTSVFGFA